MEYKPFDQVQIGDLATDYGDQIYPVVFKGTVEECFEKCGHRCSLGLSDFVAGDDADTERDVKKLEAVVLAIGASMWGDCAVYLYNLDGAVVIKKSTLFQDTLDKLRSCYLAWETQHSLEEQKAQTEILKLCHQISETYDKNGNPRPIEYEPERNFTDGLDDDIEADQPNSPFSNPHLLDFEE